MVTAREIVDVMLETGGDFSGVWLFGQNLKREGMYYRDLNAMVRSLNQYGWNLGNDYQQAIDKLIQTGYAIIHRTPTDAIVYAKKLPIVTEPTQAELARHLLGMEEDGRVIYRRGIGDRSNTMVDFDSVFVGDKNKPGSVVQSGTGPVTYKDIKGQKQIADPDKENFKPTEPPKVASTSGGLTPTHNFRLGATIDNNYEHQIVNPEERGAAIAAVFPGGPAALAHLEAGDVIQRMIYQSASEGIQKTVRIVGYDSMADALTDANPDYPIEVGFVRGGNWDEVLIMKSSSPPGTVHIPASELNKPRTESLQRRAKFVIRRKFQPNAPEPVSKTGNQPVNVSALT
jgi:hypothetical protein